MSSSHTEIQAVPTNIITGFLGVGKTSAILHLLKSKPDNERWAVLVNEFGEIGVDGSLFEGNHSNRQGVYIREVPGGCMCCAAGLPMQIALNQLLSKAKPDRLLIEPTGLGHPEEVLQVLSAGYNQGVLSLQKTLTLVDARNLSDERYTSHNTFNQQIAIADTIIGNKEDLYHEGDAEALMAYVKTKGKANVSIAFAQFGQIDIEQLNGDILSSKQTHAHTHAHHHHHESNTSPLASEQPIPACGYLKAENSGEGFTSIGWRFSAHKEFSHKALLGFLIGIKAERLKAVFITDMGIFGYNLTADGLTEVELDECFESRIEIISDQLDEWLEPKLLTCLLN